MTDEQQEQLKSAWANGASAGEIARALLVTKPVVKSWRRKLGLPSRQTAARRSVPTYFKRDVTEERLSVRALRKKYNTSVKTLHRWADEAGIALDNYKRPDLSKRPVPDDWYDVASTMTIKQLQAHYSMSDSLTRRMVKETGVKVIRPRGGGLGQTRRPVSAASTQAQTDLDAAAHHLRRFFSNVHRCDITLYSENDPARKHITWGAVRGVADGGKGYYYVDSFGIVANEDVVALARSKGWKSSYD